uniref:Sugar phosphate transporter domain-containing protein n=1 Tax=Odontella aurita TaxID=265563 RepID=A0A7S4J3U7_9STRA
MSGAAHHNHGLGLSSSFNTALVVMLSNLCFSLRGMHQKLFRSTPLGSSSSPSSVMVAGGGGPSYDDAALQYHMQRCGVFLFVVPAILWEGAGTMGKLWELGTTVGLLRSGVAGKYVFLAVINGAAFTSYNLASTYILSRISVVHHAALNCIRRLFAIVVTSVVFGVSITPLSAVGIVVSVVCFASFTRHKLRRMNRPRPLSSLLPMSAV